MPKPKPGTGPKPSIVPPERYPSGDLKPQTDAREPWSPTMIQRLKEHGKLVLGDKRLGTVLGIMHLQGIVSETEFAAGMLYAEDVGAWERIKGHPARHTRSVSFDAGYGRADLDLDALERIDPEAAAKIKAKIARRRRKIEKRYHRAQDCIPSNPILLSTLLEEVCCNDRPVHSLHHPAVKAMLKNLAEKCYRLHAPPEARKKHDHRDKKADVTHLTEAAIDAMENWFRKNRATVTTYRIQVRHEMQARAITGYGMTAENKAVETTIRIKRPAGIKGAEIDQALEKAAGARGWAKFEVKEDAA